MTPLDPESIMDAYRDECRDPILRDEAELYDLDAIFRPTLRELEAEERQAREEAA